MKVEQRLKKAQKRGWTKKRLNIVLWRLNKGWTKLRKRVEQRKGWTKPLSINWKYYNCRSNRTGLNTTKRRKVRSKSIWGNYWWLLQLVVIIVCCIHCYRRWMGCYNYDRVNLILSVFAIIFILFWCVVKIKQKQEKYIKL